MLETLQLTVTGMTCDGCEKAVIRALQQVEGVQEVSASHEANQVGIIYEADRVTPSTLKERIEALGYAVAP